MLCSVKHVLKLNVLDFCVAGELLWLVFSLACLVCFKIVMALAQWHVKVKIKMWYLRFLWLWKYILWYLWLWRHVVWWVATSVLEEHMPQSCNQNIEAVCFSEKSVTTYQTIWCYNPQDNNMKENLSVWNCCLERTQCIELLLIMQTFCHLEAILDGWRKEGTQLFCIHFNNVKYFLFILTFKRFWSMTLLF
jgi:hypothetical protein